MTNQNGRISKFYRGSATYKCIICGKQTRDTGQGEGSTVYDGEGYCAKCYEEAGYENEHSDGCHEDEYEPKCPTCRAEKEAKGS